MKLTKQQNHAKGGVSERKDRTKGAEPNESKSRWRGRKEGRGRDEGTYPREESGFRNVEREVKVLYVSVL